MLGRKCFSVSFSQGVLIFCGSALFGELVKGFWQGRVTVINSLFVYLCSKVIISSGSHSFHQTPQRVSAIQSRLWPRSTLIKHWFNDNAVQLIWDFHLFGSIPLHGMLLFLVFFCSLENYLEVFEAEIPSLTDSGETRPHFKRFAVL